MMVFRPDRTSDDEKHRTIRDAVAHGLEILRSTVLPSTFLGRKTQEPFPQEDEEPIARWLTSKELKPPK